MAVTIRPHRPDDADWVISQHGVVYRQEFGFAADFETDIREKMNTVLQLDDPFNRLWIAE